MVSYLDADSLERYLVHVLTPVYRLLEDDTTRDTGMGKSSQRQLTFRSTILRRSKSYGSGAPRSCAEQGRHDQVHCCIWANKARDRGDQKGAQSGTGNAGGHLRGFISDIFSELLDRLLRILNVLPNVKFSATLLRDKDASESHRRSGTGFVLLFLPSLLMLRLKGEQGSQLPL